MKTIIYFHIATIGNYQDVFNEIYNEIITSDLIPSVDRLNLCIVGDKNLTFDHNDKILVDTNSDVSKGEFFTLNKIKEFSDNQPNHKILYLHTKGVTNLNNECINDWRRYMTYFNVNKHKLCLNSLDNYDACGVDLVSKPAVHYSGNFWWANSSYIKTLPTISEISSPNSKTILTIRHNAEFWIGMKNGNLKNLWSSNINVYERHLHRYSPLNYNEV